MPWLCLLFYFVVFRAAARFLVIAAKAEIPNALKATVLPRES